MQNNEPIIWVNGKGSLIDFYQVANRLELNYIIYVIDISGELNSVWATAEKDIIKCFTAFSDNFLFGRIQKVEDTIEYGFLDELKKNRNGKE